MKPNALPSSGNCARAMPNEGKRATPAVSHSKSSGPPVQKQNSRRSAANLRARMYRKRAKAAGYLFGSPAAAAGTDAVQSILTVNDAKRILFFRPVDGCESYAPKEREVRALLCTEKLTEGALSHARLRVETILRRVINSTVISAVTNGKVRITASLLHAELRKYTHHMRFGGVLPPEGVRRAAVRHKVLPPLSGDDASISAAVGSLQASSKQAIRVQARKANAASVRAV